MKTLYSIWTKPGETFDYLNKQDNRKTGFTLDILFVLGSLAATAPFIVHDFIVVGDFNIYLTAILILVSALAGGLITKFISSFLIWTFAKLLQGEASIRQIRTVVAYTLVPQLINIVIFFVLIIVADINNNATIATYHNPLTQIVIWFFSVRIMIIGLSRYNKFTYGTALINIFLFAGLWYYIWN